MDKTECAWCSVEIEEGGIPHKGAMFCSQECVDDWDEDSMTEQDINLDSLDGLDGMNGAVVEEDDFGLTDHDDDDLVLSEDDF